MTREEWNVESNDGQPAAFMCCSDVGLVRCLGGQSFWDSDVQRKAQKQSKKGIHLILGNWIFIVGGITNSILSCKEKSNDPSPLRQEVSSSR